MTTFGLVHGGWLGAWTWDDVAASLRGAGHEAVAVDLPTEDGSATFETYADAVSRALEGYDDDVVIVGHSMGGHTIPLVAARRAVRHLVYLCALLPDVGRSLADQVATETDMLNPVWLSGLSEPDDQLRTRWVDRDIARRLICHDCDDATADGVLDRLRPQAALPNVAPFSLAEFPDVECTYVVCTEDQFVQPDWSRRVARERLGAQIVELPGGHSPLLSRPSAVVDVLLSL
ncbi:alpha/beta fold hydrolase [Mycobacterium paragordonae]|jgi:pimeloyl-ACP methyl ester carboxylesterase|uniref:Alpha/beta hydrolase n=1 Tax=Mycobacterium paragordonae TaxID=1389713 RepID=A0A4R5WZ38_9MYCO|nr:MULTISPECIES: alpha/beta hydrolase [Mycobacterium]MDP7735677.1 alpha/beta hydrolase [Mycobacterium paragordonae]OBK62364.1 hypothetical protein A5656_10865 [Mycobacterium gordonae]TDL01408.1 alpha/beta hydrolase [Mycobacterium paragordonae]TDL10928.1 alpha/beta hydrolase [Mycobacterium paragordonae]